jgi:GT2 family glycosyltransferase
VSIGIGVTTHNRPTVFRHTLRMLQLHAPDGAKIVVVDDASQEPVAEAAYRFERNAGIARSKNKCLELLEDCDHIFLFDDDCWPLIDDWWKPYVESAEPHLMYIFENLKRYVLNDSFEEYQDDRIKAYTHPRGCMLYFDRRVLDNVGGFDTRYARWGYEHVDISNRIYNAGLTSFRFADVVGSEELIHSGDEWQEVRTTVSETDRRKYLEDLNARFKASYKSAEYCEYRERSVGVRAKTNVVLAAYLVGQPDPQRGGQWQPNYEATKILRESIGRQGEQLVLLSDCFTEPDTAHVQHIRVQAAINPYFQRWINYWQYLRDHPEIDQVWCVDATDVEMLHNPFAEMDDRLYVGDEHCPLDIPWMRQHHRNTTLLQFIAQNGTRTLLNAGLTGGRRETVMAFIHALLSFYFDEHKQVGDFEMGAYNYIARTQFPGLIEHGRQVNTIFKTYDRSSIESWWRHK